MPVGTEQLLRRDPVEQPLPGISSDVVRLVQNHVVEGGGINRGTIPQRIDGCKNVAANGGPLALVEQFAEVAHLRHMPKDSTRLIEDLATVRDVQQRLDVSRLPQGTVIECGHDGLSGARRRDHQIAVPPEPARGREFLKDRLLEVPRLNLEQQAVIRLVGRRESAPSRTAARRSRS